MNLLMINNRYKLLALTLAITMISATYVSASEMDHGTMDHSEMNRDTMDHSTMNHDTMQHQKKKPMTQSPLALLDKLPASGKSREAGYDKRYIMEPTSAEDDINVRCAKATRGIMMVDNATWVKCGGKPEGWSKGIANSTPPSSSSNSSHHMH